MRIVVLAWGSLVWRPANDFGRLAVRPDTSWSGGGPLLPVEFARISVDGRLTLVLLPGYGSESQVLWRESGLDDLDSAIDNLAERETRAPRHAIHAVTAAGRVHGAPAPGIVDRIGRWLEGIAADAAIWTGLAPGDRWVEHGFGGFSVDAAVAYVGSLRGEARDSALEYVRNAPTQIDTPVRRALAPIVGP